MADTWPAGLPQRLQLQGASLGIGDGLVEATPDRGPPITRLGSTAVARPLAGAVILTSAQVDTFEAFFVTTLARGSLPFWFPDPRTGTLILVKFVKGQLPVLVPLGGDNFQYSFQLLVLP
ncbi:conserved hypothetical protein [Bradyrhizobium sp. ORS 278]|uniref:hypothetical protein n=1 Tax=Bradyrhizobium sp. (strain ORS 278) TaxID=114615 RepID=UPI0001508F4F|nr:hypothetical protein [Bradyrhizobium sp. ORS 278]CAL77420.1 conserved hypothetical protein [Bradyrhizobium sp. ORS 278]